jgi:carboxymethylenebutenolidase
MPTRTETITAPDGVPFAGHVALPPTGAGPGILVLQEILGVNEYIRDVCRRLSELGYVAMAPDVFFRVKPGVDCAHDEAGMQEAFGYSSQYDWATGIADLGAALAHLRALPETGGRAGAMGFCMGGTTSFGLACTTDPDVVVSYYGSGVPDWLDRADGATAPIQLHFGGDDPYIPADAIARVEAWAAERPNVEFHRYPAGHAFDNNFSDQFSEPAAARAAWANTTRFLAQHLPI